MKKNSSKPIIISGIIVVLCIGLVLVIQMYNNSLYQNASLPRNTICKSGYYFSEGECLVCPPGSYCQESIRYFCPEGTGSLQQSSTIMNCTKCAKGYYATFDGTSCIACPSDMTTNDIGSTSVNDCI